MNKAMITNSDSIEGTAPFAKDWHLSLTQEVVEGRVCPRLVNLPRASGQGQEEGISPLELLGQTSWFSSPNITSS
jgi:hypothetical protein